MKAKKLLSGLLASALALTSVAIMNIGTSAASEETIQITDNTQTGTISDEGKTATWNFNSFDGTISDVSAIKSIRVKLSNVTGDYFNGQLIINSGYNDSTKDPAWQGNWQQYSFGANQKTDCETTLTLDSKNSATLTWTPANTGLTANDENREIMIKLYSGTVGVDEISLLGADGTALATVKADDSLSPLDTTLAEDATISVPENEPYNWQGLGAVKITGLENATTFEPLKKISILTLKFYVLEAKNAAGEDFDPSKLSFQIMFDNSNWGWDPVGSSTYDSATGEVTLTTTVAKATNVSNAADTDELKSIRLIVMTETANTDTALTVKVGNLVPATGVTLNKDELTIAKGETAQLTATVAPTNSTDEVTWESSDDAVATVTDGTVTAVKAGTAIITATAGTATATCEVTVTQPVVSITINNGSIVVHEHELKKGEILQLFVDVKPTDATNKAVTWTTSNAEVATVDANGKVTAVKSGTATITATSKDDTTIKDTCAITVINPATAISIADMTVLTGAEKTIAVVTTPTDADDIGTVTYTVEDETIASVTDGKVTGLKAGETTITATAGTLTTTFKVTVTDEEVPATGVTLDKTEISVEVDATETITATVTPEDSTDDAVWSSADETIATVDQTGKVTGVKEGETTITVKLNDDVSATCTVTVTKKTIAITGITLDKTTAELTEGETVDLVATVVPDDTTEDKTVTWSSSDETVATVENGTVTAVKEGKATITAKIGDFTAECEVTVKAKAADTSDSSTGGDDNPKDEITPTEDSAVKDVAVSEKDEGAIPEGATNIKVSGNADNTKEGQISYDIVFVDEEGNVVEFSGDKMVTVSLPVPEEFKDQADKIKVYYTPDGKTFTDMKATVKDGVISFDTNHFSTYIITVNELSAADPENPNQPTGLILTIVPAIAAAGALVIFKKRK